MNLIKKLKDKLFYELQMIIIDDFYNVIDLHVYAKKCQYTNQLMRDIENKFKYRTEDELASSESDKSQTNSKSSDETFSRQQISASAVDSSAFRALIALSQSLND